MPRPAHDLDAYKETIMGCYEGGATLAQIHNYLVAEFGLDTSDRTIQRRIRDWRKEEAMPGQRTRTEDTPELRARIAQLFNEGLPGDTSGRNGASGLKDEEMLEVLRGEGFVLGSSWLQRARNEMGLTRRGKGDWMLWVEEQERMERGGRGEVERRHGRPEREHEVEGIDDEDE